MSITNSIGLKLAGIGAVVGGLCWIAAIAWYAQQPLGSDDLKEGWDTFNRYVTLIPILFIGAIIGMHGETDGNRGKLALWIVLLGTGVIAGLRLLVDVGGLPSPFVILGVLVYSVAFLWFLAVTIRSGCFPRAPTIALAVGTVLMLAFIGTDSAFIWFATPYAFAWMWVGYTLIAGNDRTRSTADVAAGNYR